MVGEKFSFYFMSSYVLELRELFHGINMERTC